MSDTSAFGFGQFVPGFDFLQNLSKTAAQAQPAAAAGLAGALDGVGAAGAGLADKVGRRSTGRAGASSAGAAVGAGRWGGRELDEDIGRIVAGEPAGGHTNRQMGRRADHKERPGTNGQRAADYPCRCCHARNSCAGTGRLMW